MGAYGVHYWHCSHPPPSIADMDAMTSCDNQQFCCCGILAHLFWRDGPCPAILSGEMTISAVDQWRGPVPLPAWGCAWDRCNISWDRMHPHSDQWGPKPSTYSWPALRPHLHRREAKEARRKKNQEKNLKQLERWMWYSPHAEIISREQKPHWLKSLEYSLCLITADH